MLAAAFALDLFLTPNPARAKIDRILPERAGLSRPFRRILSVDCPGASGLRAEVHEQFPAPFAVVPRSRSGELVPAAPSDTSIDPSGGPDRGRFAPGGRVELERVYRANLRGLFLFGRIRLRVRGPLGLVERQARFQGAQSIAVEPALPSLKRTLELAASERWRDLGVRLLRRHGGEREFESLREYAPGDDVRRIDWKAFARRGKPMMRSYEVERGQELFLLVDRGRRMRVVVEGALTKEAQQGWTKLDWALDAALVLSAVALSKGDRVGAAAFDRSISAFVAPDKGKGQLARLTQALFHLDARSEDSDLALALRELAARHRREATVIVLSDAADPLSVAEQRAALASAPQRHRLVFAALDDPELRAAARGEGVSASVQAAALSLIDDRRRALRELSATGARVLDALPAEAAPPLLAAWLAERRR